MFAPAPAATAAHFQHSAGRRVRRCAVHARTMVGSALRLPAPSSAAAAAPWDKRWDRQNRQSRQPLPLRAELAALLGATVAAALCAAYLPPPALQVIQVIPSTITPQQRLVGAGASAVLDPPIAAFGATATDTQNKHPDSLRAVLAEHVAAVVQSARANATEMAHSNDADAELASACSDVSDGSDRDDVVLVSRGVVVGEGIVIAASAGANTTGPRSSSSSA